MMDDAMKKRVIAELRSDYPSAAELDWSGVATGPIGQRIAFRLAMDDLRRTLERDTWPSRMFVRLADVASRALARMVRR